MAAAALTVASGSASAQSPAAPAPVSSDGTPSLRVGPENARLNTYLHDLAGPGAFVGMVGGGLLDHLWRKPSSWDDDADGLARRIGARASQAAVQVSVRHGLAALMDRSTTYQPCECKGFGPKVEHALLETFTDRRADGSRALSIPTIAGTYAGGLTRMAWESDRSAGDVVLGTTLSFGFTAVFNIARELTGLAR
ncbi:MAG TPA: hypothetical protein VE399_07015 [Gemmatimonadales bacterium]|jgi:hypothetical protein|nr:hypothetical protein [Gemmatimonadales bacterium]